MTDRELLELAAKVAEYRVHGWIADRLYVVDQSDPAERFDPFVWNPIKDDGDALRLAVALAMDVDLFRGVVICASADFDIECGDYRRAIVRAAAEIGRK